MYIKAYFLLQFAIFPFTFLFPKMEAILPQTIDEVPDNRNMKQPSVLILGYRKQPSRSFVIVEECIPSIRYYIEGIVIYSHFRVRYNYSCQCSTSWEFIQIYVFELLGRTFPDHPYPVIFPCAYLTQSPVGSSKYENVKIEKQNFRVYKVLHRLKPALR